MLSKEPSLFSINISFFFVLRNRFLLPTLSLSLLLHFNNFLIFSLSFGFFFRWLFRRIKLMLISAEFRRALYVTFLTIIDRQGLDSIC